ncbi:HECT E3 ubiquitin ligase [Phytophthora megakarya]|uniref:HECT-type E3 ubiquitin transferase n=1 Tax=Phytophthora megakarya TaxID=4795 RepID=A0A225WQT6_9STRA|nr:HECT E3 ubiquitin ligase [Phytophthora megakarya]
MEVDIDTRQSTNSAGSGFYPLREEDDDDVSMRSPLSGMGDHDMNEEDEDEEHSEDDHDDDEFEEHHHLHISRRAGGHGSSRRTSSNRLWGALDSELSILDALDEVDEEEFSYLNMLDDEAFFAEEQRGRDRLAAARNVRPGSTNEGSQLSRSSEDRLVESMRDALGLYNSGGSGVSSSSTGQTLVLTFGDLDDEEYVEELPDMLDDDFLFESFDAGGRGDRSRRERQLGRSGSSGMDQFSASSTIHPLLRTSGRGDAILLDSNGLLRNPGRVSLPRHSSLLRELQELTDQVQTQLPLGSRSRLALGRDLLQRGGPGSRGRPPSRINRLSAVSNLLSEFSLDIPTSTLPSRNQRLGLRRGDRDIFSDVFVGIDLSRGIGSRGSDATGNISNPSIWGPGARRDVDVRSVASRLEQQITRICADDNEPAVTPTTGRGEEVSSHGHVVIDDSMENHSAGRTPRSGEHTASESRGGNAEGSDARPNTSVNYERHDVATDAASVLELTSTLGETSLLRSPPESDVDVDIVDADTETLSEDQETTVASPLVAEPTTVQGNSSDSLAPPPAPVSLTSAEVSATATTASTSDTMMNFTLDLSAFDATSSQLAAASENTSRMRTVEEESKSEVPSASSAATQELSVALHGQQDEQQEYQCPEGMDAEVFASLPPDMQAEIIAQNTPVAAESATARSDTASAGGGGSESMSQMDLDMANSSFDRETLEALPPDIRAEVLENERREREAAARAETADTSRAQEMDNASFVASLAPELREEILVTCDDAFLQTLPSQVRAEAMVLRERAAFRSTYRERDRGTEERGGGEGDMDELFNRPTLRRMLTSHSPERGSSRRRSRMYDELGGGRRGSRRDYRQGTNGSKVHKGLLRVEKDEEEEVGDRIFDDQCVRGLLRLLFMTQSVIQNRVFQRLLANICLYPLTRSSVRRNLLQVISLPLSHRLIPGDVKDDDDDGSGKIQFPPSRMYGCGIDGNRAIRGSAVPAEVVNRMLHVLVSLAKYNPRFTVEMLQPHDMRHASDEKRETVKMESKPYKECGVAVLIDLLSLPVVYRNGTNLDALLELLELVLSPLERLHNPNGVDEEKKEGDEGDSSTLEHGDEWVVVPAVELDDGRMREIVSVLGMDLCTVQMQERTLAVLKLLNHVRGNRELVIRAVVQHASTLARVDRYTDGKLSPEITGYESSAVLPSAQDELKLLRLLHSLSDVCESTAEFTECCQTIGLDQLWDALSLSLTEARANGGLDDQDNTSATSAAASSSSGSVAGTDMQAATEDSEGTVIEGKSAGASCAMAALLARFLPMVEAFFVVNARDAASMSLRVPDSSEREEAVVAALRVGGFDGAGATALMGTDEQKISPKSVLKRSSSAISSMSEAGETMRLANFVESNRVLLNLLVREKPSLLDTSLAALIKIPRCRAYLAFDNKRTYFHSAMKRLRQTALRNHGGGSSSVRIPVRREHIFEDSYYALRMRSGTELRRKLHISFTGEEGIDAGGVTREWYMILAREMFNPNYVLFTSAADSPTFQPNPLSYVNKDHLSYFEFVGKVLGKAVADGQLLDAHFTRSFYKHILQLPISYHDMEAIDPEYYRNLHSILDNSIVDLGLELTFSAEQSNFGKVEVVDLIPNGRNVPVTDENKMEYVKLVTHHRMATGIRQQIDAFLKGFHQLVPPELIAIFNENELELLISGMPEIDIDDLKANTEYANFKPTDAVIRWFWNVLYAFTHEERALFLQFVTGTSKVPLEGFKALEGMRGTQKFNIHKAFGNNSALPSAHTW